MIKLVCFDIGGVLVRIRREWSVCAEHVGVSAPEDFRIPIETYPPFNNYQKGVVSFEVYQQQVRTHLGCSPEQAAAIHNSVLQEPYPGTNELVAALQEKNILTACLSNTNEPHFTHMSFSGKFPAISRLDFRVASYELNLLKPDEAIYHAFQSKTSCKADEILFFDDSMANVEGAQRCGWHAEWIDHSGDPAQQMRASLERHGVRL